MMTYCISISDIISPLWDKDIKNTFKDGLPIAERKSRIQRFDYELSFIFHLASS